MVAIARENGWRAAAVTFDPHPTKLVAPAEAPHLLTTPDQRARIMEQLGIDAVLIVPFTHEIAQLSPEEFVRELLVDRLHARAVVVGDNFRFGHRASGDVQTLEELGAKYSFETDIVQAVVRRGRVISSTAIRRLIAAGEVSLACRMLGRPYAWKATWSTAKESDRNKPCPR